MIDDTENDYENDNENVNEAVEAVVPVDESALDPVPSRSIDYVDGDEYQSSNDQSDDDGDEDGDGDRDEDFNSVSKLLHHGINININIYFCI